MDGRDQQDVSHANEASSTVLLVAMLTSGAAGSEGDPIFEQYRAEGIDGLFKPALQEAEVLAMEGLLGESNQVVLDALPEEKRRPVHNFALGNMLYRTRPDLSRALHRKAVEALATPPERARVRMRPQLPRMIRDCAAPRGARC